MGQMGETKSLLGCDGCSCSSQAQLQQYMQPEQCIQQPEQYS
jgi:hypothetical protein